MHALHAHHVTCNFCQRVATATSTCNAQHPKTSSSCLSLGLCNMLLRNCQVADKMQQLRLLQEQNGAMRHKTSVLEKAVIGRTDQVRTLLRVTRIF